MFGQINKSDNSPAERRPEKGLPIGRADRQEKQFREHLTIHELKKAWRELSTMDKD